MIDSGQSAVRLPLVNKLLFAADHIGLQSMGYFRQQWVLFFLAPPAMEGMSRVPDVTLLGFDIDARVLAGVLIFAGRFIDAFTDPLIGWWSDRTRSRWGRRIPFILFSTPFYAAFGALVWFLPTEGGSWWNALYFVLMLELFFTAATMSSGALEALVPELTRTPQDRMSVVSLIFLFAVTGAGLGLVMGGFLKDAYGIQVAGTVFALMALAFRYLSLRGVWNRAPRDVTPAQVPFWQGLTDTLRNSQFVAFLPTFVMFTTGVGLLQGWVPFFAVGVLLQDRDGTASSFLSMSVIAGVVVAGIVIWALFAAGRGHQKAHLRRVPGGERPAVPAVGTGWSGVARRPAGAGAGVHVHRRHAHGCGVHAAQGADRRHRRLRRLGHGRTSGSAVLRDAELL